MSNPLRSVVHVSVATMPMDSSSLEGLLVEARDYNLETGMLHLAIDDAVDGEMHVLPVLRERFAKNLGLRF